MARIVYRSPMKFKAFRIHEESGRIAAGGATLTAWGASVLTRAVAFPGGTGFGAPARFCDHKSNPD